MAHRLVVGAGPIGSALVRRLVAAGDTVTVVTRSGRGPDLPGVTRVAANAADPARLTELATGAATVFNCANPGDYTRWEAEWPPLAAALLTAAERSGAVLVTLGNLYGYGPVDVPISRDLPLAATGHKGRLRNRMWQDALAAHRAGRVRATEVRAADYIGPEVTAAGAMLRRYADVTLRGRAAWVFGDPDVPHTFSDSEDVARLLALVADDERAWGEPWHVPAAGPRSMRQALTDLGAAIGAPAPRLRRVPTAAITLSAPVVPIMRELQEVLWQFQRPFVLDAAATTEAFGVTGSPWEETVVRTAQGWRPR
ncbi:NAD-dependent epimerase/dehydratase family protein [Cellulomonas sp. RIT-PI-Y]|uniref:NAD-dependent epimerase/dehydratase family protein n=1 Tax=Cellulomonas sp. RIT-PI-Y TaxID=3035297 RepID=UPI0021DA3632|nr:NAD-dependent epimerase/dehydratase family protein [Cellulomonas sp. RIT-PI-Y]